MCVTTHMSTQSAPKFADGRHFMNLGRGGVDDQAGFRLGTTAFHKQHAALWVSETSL